MFTPTEKFAAATTPIPAPATTSRNAASWAVQPVVPMTVLRPMPASRGRFSTTASAVREVDGDVGRGELARFDRFSGRVVVDVEAGHHRAVDRPGQRVDLPPHPSETDQYDAEAHRNRVLTRCAAGSLAPAHAECAVWADYTRRPRTRDGPVRYSVRRPRPVPQAGWPQRRWRYPGPCASWRWTLPAAPRPCESGSGRFPSRASANCWSGRRQPA